jgi:general secretion pathway protein D
MKHSIPRMMTAAWAVGWLTAVVAQDAAAPATTVVSQADAAAPAAISKPTATASNPDEIRLNFRNAPLELVLEYLSEAAGFIIVLDTPAKGTVNIISSKPVTRDEAVDLLNSVLNKNGLAAIRDGRTLTVVDRVTAKTRDIPVKVNNDPAQIPKNDEIVTQIIPIRFVEADQLVKDLSTFISPQATFVANTAGNSIVMTDTQSNIRHIVEIIKAIDTSAEAETQIRVFHLKHASPSDVANALSSVFPSNNGTGNNNQAPVRFGGQGGFGGFGGFPGFGGGGFGGAGGGRGGGGGGGAAAGGSSAQSDRIKRASQVLAVADGRTSSVIVTAAKDLMNQIAIMVTELDVPALRDQQVFVFHMTNGDPQQALQVLQNMFQTSTTSRSGSSSASQNSALMQRQQNNTTTTGSTTSGSSFGSGSSGRTGGGQLF